MSYVWSAVAPPPPPPAAFPLTVAARCLTFLEPFCQNKECENIKFRDSSEAQENKFRERERELTSENA